VNELYDSTIVTWEWGYIQKMLIACKQARAHNARKYKIRQHDKHAKTLWLQAYPEGVGHGRKKSDKASANCSPCEDALLALGVVEKELQGLLQNTPNIDQKSNTLLQTGSSDNFMHSVNMSHMDNTSSYYGQVHTVIVWQVMLGYIILHILLPHCASMKQT